MKVLKKQKPFSTVKYFTYVQYLDLREKYFKPLMADGNKRSCIIAQRIVFNCRLV